MHTFNTCRSTKGGDCCPPPQVPSPPCQKKVTPQIIRHPFELYGDTSNTHIMCQYCPMLPVPHAANNACDTPFTQISKTISPNIPSLLFPTLHQLGFTPLMYAARYGNDVILAALLEAGADINATNQKGQSALYQAVVGQHGSVM